MKRILFFPLLCFFVCDFAFADRGFVAISDNPNVNVYGKSQKAIVAWNGTREAMILSTDCRSNEKNIKAIGFIPLPTPPIKAEKCNFSSFERLQEIIRKNSGGYRFEIKFNKHASLRDIKSERTENLREFINWLKAYYLKYRTKYNNLVESRFLGTVKSYLDSNSKYFVFDCIDVQKSAKSTDPIIYVFNTSFLYYPLRIATVNFDKADIKLFLITENKPNIWATRSRFSCGAFADGKPIKFKIGKNTLKNIHPEIYALFIDLNKEYVWLTVAGFLGDLKDLKKDFKIYR